MTLIHIKLPALFMTDLETHLKEHSCITCPPPPKKKPSPCTLHTSLIRILCVETAEHFSLLFLLLASKPAPYKAGNVLVTCSHYCCGCPTHLQLWCCSGSFGSFEGLEVKEMRVEMPAIPPHVRALPSLPPSIHLAVLERAGGGRQE